MAETGTISLDTTVQTEPGVFNATAQVFNATSSSFHCSVTRNSGSIGAGEFDGGTYITFTAAESYKEFTIPIRSNTDSEVNYQGESFTISLRTGIVRNSGTLLDSLNFTVYDDDTGISSIANLSVGASATSHTPSITFTYSDSGGSAPSYRIQKNGSTIFTGTAASPPGGTVTPTVNDVPAQASSQEYVVQVYNGTAWLTGPSYFVTRGGTNRVLLGYDGSDYVLKVSAPGKNVLTITEPTDFLFDSTKSEASMAYKAGSTTVTVGSSQGSYYSNYVYYNADNSALNYVPLVLGSYVDGSNNHRRFPGQNINVFTYDANPGGLEPILYFAFYNYNTFYIETDLSKFRIRVDQSSTLGFPTGVATFYYTVLPIGGITPVVVT